ncbi:DsbA family protein [Oscillochloris sp. ZM17-4]|uniref:DsbA family protein n=1 Tax=Oscillochloris sp. ZM17-4 TaxID=2866714 RepID=UPI001C7346A0|nr:DsbA family protein [Oscillochloris sp. ZM17-4]MBX0329428.1 DsbA family protein [Oscillochloris sp. ZM17-4]
MRTMRAILTLAALALTGCGAYAPPAPPLSALEERQTAVAMEGRPTLPTLPAATAAPPPPMPDILKVFDDDPRALGSLSAPVTIYEFTDFECPFCKQFVDEARPQLIQQFVDAGVVRLVARDFPLTEIHPSAMLAAMAGRCAADQQMFWPMYETLFSTHRVEWGGVPKRDHDALIELAGRVGLDTTAFASCLDDPATEQAVRDEADAAAKLGVNSTPNFMINGQMIRGALPFSSFNMLIRRLVQQ